MAKKKYNPSPCELRWDPSLKFHDYQKGEVMTVAGLTDPCRFLRREGDNIVIATMALAELPFRIPKLSIRRPVFDPPKLSEDDKVAIVAGAHATFGTRHLSKEH